MADYQYSAELELNTRDFTRNLAEAEKSLLRFGNEAKTGVVDKGLLQLQERFKGIQSAGNIFSATMRKVGADSKIAQSGMRVLANQSEKLLRDLNKYGAGAGSTIKFTPVQKDQAKIANDLARAIAGVNRQFEAKRKAEASATAAAEKAARAEERAAAATKKREQAEAQRMGSLQARAIRENQAYDLAKINAAIRAQDEFVNSLGNTRYALQEVSNVAFIASAATLGMATAAVALSASYERAFADVERTSGAVGTQLEQLHDSIIGLTTEMPTSFADLTSIATLGGQLGIAAENIDDFTKTVSQFAATTDVTVDAAAEGLGRLAQLTKTPQSEMQNLGSAIYEVGINSVATESAILGVAQQIAVSGNLAGFSADQIVALSGALASLGVAPEAARGSIMRIFNEIRTAVDAGGDSLELFADTAGVTAEEFQNMWRNDPQSAFLALVHGLDGAADSGENLIGILQEMGVWAVRDQRALQLLADNTEVYEQAIADSAGAYAEGTALGEGYAIVADTLSSKIQILIGTLKSLVAEGFAPLGGFISKVIDFLQPMAEVLLSVAQSPVGSAILSWVGGLTALVGVAALVVAGWARLNSALIAVLQTMNATVRANREADGSQRSLNSALREHITLLLQQRAAQGSATAATLLAAQANKTSTAGMTGFAKAATQAKNATLALGTAGKSLGWMAAISIAVAGLTKAFEAYNYATRTAEERAADLFGADSTGLAQAIKDDTEAWKEGADTFRTYTSEIGGTGEELSRQMRDLDGSISDVNTPGWVSDLEDATGAQVDLANEVDATSDTIRQQTVAIGENAREFIANTLANDKHFQDMFRNSRATWERYGLDVGELLNESLTGSGNAGEVIQQQIDQIKAAMEDLANTPVTAPIADQEAAQQRLTQLKEDLYALEQLQRQFETTDSAINSTLSNMDLMSTLTDGLNLSGAADETDEFATALAGLADGLFDAVSAQGAFTTAMIGLHEALAENGNDFSVYSEGGVANMEALQQAVEAASAQAGQSLPQFGANLASIFAQMEGAGYTAGSELDFLRQQLVATFNQSYGLDLDISNARGSIHQFIQDAITALQVRAQIERASFSGTKALSNGESRGGLPGQVTGGNRRSGLPNNLEEINNQITELQRLQLQLTKAGNQGRKTGQGIKDAMNEGAKGAKNAGDAAKDAADKAKDAAEELYTLIDYANDLNSIFDRAVNLRFGNQNAQDDTTSILQDMKEAAEESAEKIRDLRNEIRDLKADLGTLAADRKVLEFQLGVAVEYGDELRAADIRAELGENSAETNEKQEELKDTQKDLRKEQDKNTKSLKGNSKGAINNRKAVQDLLGSYQDQLTTMAENGATQDELKTKSERLREEFKKQLIQMGYNKDEVDDYADAFDDFTQIIKEVPRNVTVTAKANTSPATQALNEWIAKNKNKEIKIKTTASKPSLSGTVSGGSWKPSSIGVGSGGISTPNIYGTKGLSSPYITGTRGMSSPSIHGTSRIYTPRIDATKIYGGSIGKAGSFRTGGHVGTAAEYHATGGIHGMHPGSPRGSDTTPAWLTPGEFVQNKRAVNHYGLPFMNAINSMKFPRYFAGGGAASGGRGNANTGIQLVELLPGQFRQLVNAVASQVVKIGNQTIANAGNAANTRASQRGSN